MAPSNRQQILETLAGRCEAIRVSSGFNTDAGANVLLGEVPAFGPDDPKQSVCILPDDDIAERTQEQVLITLPVAVAALVDSDLRAPWAIVEQILQDIKRAVEVQVPEEERTGRTLGGILQRRMTRGNSRIFQRREGTTAVGVEIVYLCPYVEPWGNP